MVWRAFQYDDRSGQVASGPFEESLQRHARSSTSPIKTILHRGGHLDEAPVQSPRSKK